MKTADNAELCQVIEAIGLPAVLEQCAEELAELTQAALKMARKAPGRKSHTDDTRPSGGASA